MKHEIANTNVSFEFLRNSGEFQNIVLNNITSCILLLDKEMKLHAFNDSMKTIFSNHKDEHLLYRRCGEALGCAFQIEEAKDCGKTSHCKDCEIRIAGMESYVNNVVVYKDHIEKPFFNFAGEKVNKHLQFSTRLFKFQGEKYIIMIVEDITKLVEMKKLLVSN